MKQKEIRNIHSHLTLYILDLQQTMRRRRETTELYGVTKDGNGKDRFQDPPRMRSRRTVSSPNEPPNDENEDDSFSEENNVMLPEDNSSRLVRVPESDGISEESQRPRKKRRPPKHPTITEGTCSIVRKERDLSEAGERDVSRSCEALSAVSVTTSLFQLPFS